MFGFFIGAIAVFGLFSVLRHRSWHRYGYGRHGWHGPHHLHPRGFGPCGPSSRGHRHGYQGGHDGRQEQSEGADPSGYDPYREEDYEEPRRGFQGRDWVVDRLVSRINATPEQAQVLRAEIGEFFAHTKGMRGELGSARADVAKAFRSPSFDETVMGESFGRQDDKIRDVRERLVGALVRVHDVLEPDQRQQLAGLFERGFGWGGRRGGRGGW